MEFMQDALAGGRTVRNLTVLNIYTRECVAGRRRRRSAAPTSSRVLSDLPIICSFSAGLGHEPLGSRTKIGIRLAALIVALHR